MNFKEIQLVGFKSFADKTSIKFDDGVTCIVGPNGCGKSNVADAVRWVLGEQSAKTLRGSSMQDVIFNGTETRRQLSYCEVTLVFDNSQHIFDIAYEEVAMTRRLYRSGESEYLLNKQPCRLKDIVALLHGVGIGKEGYSIIGQGKVEQIMNAKPEDRRAIFEEATGVMAFKVRKGEIERKIEAAKDNLSIFSQRMDETERQLKPLEKQAETARLHREYSAQLKYEEINTYVLRVENAAIQEQKYRQHVENANVRLKELEDSIKAVTGEADETRLKIDGFDDELKRLHEVEMSYVVKVERKSGEARLIAEKIKHYGDELEKASNNTIYARRRIREIEGEVASSLKQIEKNTKELTQIEEKRKKLFVKVEEAEMRAAAYEKVAAQQRESELSSVENLSALRRDAGSLSARRDAAGERIEEVRLAIEKEEGKKKEYADQLALTEKGIASREESARRDEKKQVSLQEEIRDLRVAEQQLARDISECERSISNYRNNLNTYIGLKNQFNGYRDSVRNLQLKALNDKTLAARMRGTVADIVSTGQEYEVAIETAFGGAMQNIVTDTQDDARFLIEYLKRTDGGIVTFLPATSMRPHFNSREISLALKEKGAVGLADELVRYDEYYEKVISNLLGNTLICDNIANATEISKKFRNAFKIVTLDGDVIATGGAVSGGSRRKGSGNLLAAERRIKESEEGIQKKTALLEKLRAALEKRTDERGEAEKELEALRAKAIGAAEEIASQKSRLEALQALVAGCESDLAGYRALYDSLTQKIDDLESQVLSAEESESMLSKIRTAAKEESAAQSAEAEKVKEELEKLKGAVHDLDIERTRLLAENSALNSRVEEAHKERDDTLVSIDRLHKEIAAAESIVKELKEQEERVSLTEEEQGELSELRKQIAELESEKKRLNARVAELSEKEREHVAEQQTVGNARGKSEVELAKIETGLETWRQRMQESYDLTFDSALLMRDPEYDITQSAHNIESLRRKISALGSVNQNAEQDYAEILARYEEMQTSREDLTKGIDDLSGVLATLRDEMQKKFDEGFNEINGNFTKIFKELFGGGRAEMRLDYTDCDDPLNAGIEIVACPPGKKLTKISLLSGGERAFTAIAILFAILKSRPMPFCILDEIEAALDEANVDRFAKYLKKFSKETQFIVITHRKPTMNQADCLFGVTMEEKGVSKIVSVKLSEVEERLGGDTVI